MRRAQKDFSVSMVTAGNHIFDPRTTPGTLLRSCAGYLNLDPLGFNVLEKT